LEPSFSEGFSLSPQNICDGDTEEFRLRQGSGEDAYIVAVRPLGYAHQGYTSWATDLNFPEVALKFFAKRAWETAANSVNGSVQAKSSLNASCEQVNKIWQISGDEPTTL